MKITAQMCDRCGRLEPGESKPLEWVEVVTSVVGQSRSKEEGLFCSDKCAGLWFRNRDTADTEEPEEAVVFQEEDYSCPHCSWTPGSRRTGGKTAPLTHPDQSLRMHIHRMHGSLTGDPRKKAS